MDIVIPSHSVRTFGAAISCLSRIGSGDLYMEFDAISGLDLRALNDAKSAYAHVHFEPSFFERCTRGPETRTSSRKKRHRPNGPDNDSADDTTNNGSHNNNTQNDDTGRFACRVVFKALSPVVRPRKNLHSLRVTTTESSDGSNGDIFCLDFEFTMRHLNDALLSAVHRVRIADAAGVSVVVSTEGASEIAAVPSVLARLLEPLQRTVEAALIVRNNGSNSSVSASSFHHSDATSMAGGGTAAANARNNAILQASTASLLKSETACGSDEFLDFDFVSNRDVLDNDDEANDESLDIPEEVNQEVILVFSLREAKAMLQFCCLQQEQLVVNVLFHWGGKPLVLTSNTPSFSIQLVLATLDYKLLTSMRTMATAKDD